MKYGGEMLKNTTNFGLKKPESTDFYNVDDFNDNMDVIDQEMKTIDEKFEHLESNDLSIGRKPETTRGTGSAALGKDVEASGIGSCAEGNGTVAKGAYQHVQGKYNVPDIKEKYAHIVGGGSKGAEKNIHTIDWQGNAEFAGDVIANGCDEVPSVSLRKISEGENQNVFTTATELEELESGETMKVILGKIAKAVKDLISHLADRSNPHKVTASQVGLGNVPNVTTNNQTPTFATASTLTALTSGETLKTSLGKIAKAVKDLISHLANKSNPHEVTASQISAVATSRIANNLTTTGSGYVLDARQGKNLYEKMQNIKLGTILARGSETSLALSAGVITKIPLTVSDVKNPGCLATGNKYTFELTEDGGIKCPYTGFVLVSGATYISGKSGNETARGCYIKRKTANGSGEYGEEMEVCSQLIRDLGGTGGIHAGTLAIAVQDADVFYLYARSSSASTCNPSNVATYLSLTYLTI